MAWTLNTAAVVGASKVAPVYGRMRGGSGRVHIGLIGDSTMEFAGNGFDYGDQYALETVLGSTFPAFGTGLFGPGEGAGAGTASGYFSKGFAAGAGVIHRDAPAGMYPYLQNVPYDTQSITISGTWSGGSFALGFTGSTGVTIAKQTTATLGTTATRNDLALALRNLAAISDTVDADVIVRGLDGTGTGTTLLTAGAVTVQFRGAYAYGVTANPSGGRMNLLTVESNTMTGGAVVAIAEVEYGNLGTLEPYLRLASGAALSGGQGLALIGHGSYETRTAAIFGLSAALQANYWTVRGPSYGSASVSARKNGDANENVRISVQYAIGGTFTLSHGGNTTAALAWNASAATIDAALEGLASIGAGNVTVFKAANPTTWSAYQVVWGGAFAGVDAGAITANAAGLTSRSGFTAQIQVDTTQGGTGAYTTISVADGTVGGNNASVEVYRTTLTVNAGSRDYGVGMQTEKSGTTPGANLLELFQQIERPDRTAGWAVTPVVYRGGCGLRVMAEVLQGSTNAYLTALFTAMRQNCVDKSQTPMVLFRIRSGTNDIADTGNSRGAGLTASNTEAGFLDNLTAIRDRINAVWTLNGWSLSEVYFEVMVSTWKIADDTDQDQFRSAARTFANTFDRCAAIDATMLVENFAEAQTFFAAGGTDSSHHIIEGYERYSERYLRTMLQATLQAGGNRVATKIGIGI